RFSRDWSSDVCSSDLGGLHGAMCICHSYEEADLSQTFQHAHCLIGSDATALAVDGPLAASTFLGAYTWAGWFFRRFVRETGTFRSEERRVGKEWRARW